MSLEKIKSFISWKNSLHKEERGGELMWDVPKHHVWLKEDELFSYYFKNF